MAVFAVLIVILACVKAISIPLTDLGIHERIFAVQRIFLPFFEDLLPSFDGLLWHCFCEGRQKVVMLIAVGLHFQEFIEKQIT